MINLVIALVLLWHFYLGYTRGLVKQTYYFVASILSLVAAGFYYQPLSDRLTLWVPYTQAVEEVPLTYFSQVNIFEMDTVFYAGLAFVVIFFTAYAFLAFLGIFLHLLPLGDFDDVTYNLISGFLAVLVTLIGFNLVLTLLATLPIAPLQTRLAESWLVKGLIDYFPALSQLIDHLWVIRTLG